jgi:hypothetical protein
MQEMCYIYYNGNSAESSANINTAYLMCLTRIAYVS